MRQSLMAKVKVISICIVAFLVHAFFSFYGTTQISRLILNSLSGFIGEYSPDNTLRMSLDLIISAVIMVVSVLLVYKLAKEKVLIVVSCVSIPLTMLFSYSYLGDDKIPFFYSFGCVFTSGVLPILLAAMIKDYKEDVPLAYNQP
tara:strand:- start:515 stop:949 length:435 start_codon:yes stop_codon:yes gene_type:complete